MAGSISVFFFLEGPKTCTVIKSYCLQSALAEKKIMFTNYNLVTALSSMFCLDYVLIVSFTSMHSSALQQLYITVPQSSDLKQLHPKSVLQ